MNATVIPNAIKVTPVGNGIVVYLETECQDHDAYADLPVAVEFQGRVYGKTGWNSDSCRAYYKPNVPVAFAQ